MPRMKDQPGRDGAAEYQLAMRYLDKLGVPRHASEDGGKVYSLVGRIARLSAASAPPSEGSPSEDTDPSDTTLRVDGCNFFLRLGTDRYTLVMQMDGAEIGFVLEQHTPREGPSGVIDADPRGTVRIGSGGGFVACYPEGWAPPARLQAIVQEALDNMGAGARPGYLKPRAPGDSDAN